MRLFGTDAFQSCQAEQCRVIDAVYGSLLGRDKSFKDQVRALVDAQKELVRERTVTFINPGALTQGMAVRDCGKA